METFSKYIDSCITEAYEKYNNGNVNINCEWNIENINIAQFNNVDYNLTKSINSEAGVNTILDIIFYVNQTLLKFSINESEFIKRFLENKNLEDINLDNVEVIGIEFIPTRSTSSTSSNLFSDNFKCIISKETIYPKTEYLNIFNENKKAQCVLILKNIKSFILNSGTIINLITYKTTNITQLEKNLILNIDNELFKIETKLNNQTFETIKTDESLKNNLNKNILDYLIKILTSLNNDKYLNLKNIENEMKNNSILKEYIKQNKKLPIPKSFQYVSNLNESYVLEKTDGIHNFIFIFNKNMYILNSKLENICLVATYDYEIDNCLFEGEYVFNEENNNATFHIFDVLYFKDKSTINLTFDNRMKTIDENFCIKLNNKIIIESYDKYPDLQFVLKQYSKYNPELEIFTKGNNSETNEGIIFVIDNGDYYKQNIYKWKYLNKLSIDMVVYRNISEKFIKSNNEIYNLYIRKNNNIEQFVIDNIPQICSIDKEHLKKSSGQNRLYNGCVYEFIFTAENKWVPIKLRLEKTLNNKPNAYLTAINVYNSIIEPILLTDLTNIETIKKKEYYSSEKMKKTENQEILSNYNRLIIKEMIYLKSGLLLKGSERESEKKELNYYEIGYGIGNDINRILCSIGIISNKTINIYGCDPNNDNSEFYTRIKNTKNRNKKCILKTDIKQLSKTKFTNKSLYKQFDIISSQFSIHYLLNDFGNILNILGYIYDKLNTGGIFLGMTLNLDEIRNILQSDKEINNIRKTKNKITAFDDNKSIFWEISLNKLNMDAESEEGIVTIPSANINEKSVESIISMKSFIKEAKNVGFKIIVCDTFNIKENDELYKLLFENNDKTYIEKIYKSSFNNNIIKMYIDMNFYFILQK